MKIQCAWCGKDLGEKEPLDDGRVTHGICQECKTVMEAEDTAPAPTKWIEPAPTPGAFRIGAGWVSPWNGDRPR